MGDLLRRCKGFVRFDIIGQHPERLFNVLCENGFDVWGLRRRGDVLSAAMSRKNYLKIRPFCKRTSQRTRVTERCGLPFFLKKHRLRVGFFAGVALFFATLFFLSGFVWNVTVVGNSTIPDTEILSALDSLGLREGVKTSSVDPEELRMRLALKVDGIAWASINIEGVRATVNIAESRPLKGETEQPCNLVAERDGVIVGIEVEAGTVDVKLGQTVREGDRLASGLTQYKDGTYRFDVAKGRIFAETEREISCFIPFSQSRTVRSGETVTRRAVSFFGIKVPLYLGTVKGEYEVEPEVRFLKRDGMYLPIKLYETVFFKTVTQNYTVSEDEALALAETQLEISEKTELENVEILQKATEIKVENGGLRLTAKYSCRENIAKKDLLLILE